MPTLTRKLEVVIIGDDRSLTKALGSAGGATDSFEKKTSSMSSKVVGAVGAAFATGAIVNFGQDLLDMSSQLTAIDTKVKTVFEGQAVSIRKWADQNNEAFGLTDDQLAGLAANFGDLLKPMGFTADQAAAMSKDVVGLAGALSAWSGGQISAEGAAEKLAAAMLGERDGLKELGIAISQADVDARLAAKGQKELTGAALEQAEAVATQELIFEKSTDAQAAWAAGGNKALTAQNKLKATVGELKEKLATALVPVMLKVFEVGMKLTGWFAEHKAALVAAGVVIAAIVVPAFISWAVAAGTAAVATIAATAPIIAIGLAVAAAALLIIGNWDRIKGAFGAAKDFIVNNIGTISRVVLGFATFGMSEAVRFIADHWNSIIGFFAGIPGRISAISVGMWDGVKNAFRTAVNWIIRGWNAIEFRIPGFDPPGPGPKFGGFTLGLPDIPLLSRGAVVTSPMVAILGDNPSGREAVVPLERAAEFGFGRNGNGDRGGVTIIVQGSVIAERELLGIAARSHRRGFAT